MVERFGSHDGQEGIVRRAQRYGRRVEFVCKLGDSRTDL